MFPQAAGVLHGWQRLLDPHCSPAAQSELAMHPHRPERQSLLVEPVEQLSGDVEQLQVPMVQVGVVPVHAKVPAHMPAALHTSPFVQPSPSSHIALVEIVQSVVLVAGTQARHWSMGSTPGVTTEPAMKQPAAQPDGAQMRPGPHIAPASSPAHGFPASIMPPSAIPIDDDEDAMTDVEDAPEDAPEATDDDGERDEDPPEIPLLASEADEADDEAGEADEDSTPCELLVMTGPEELLTVVMDASTACGPGQRGAAQTPDSHV